MVVLIDTNVIMDYITKREGFYEHSRLIVDMCSSDKIKGYVAFHSLPTIWYLLRSVSIEDRRLMIKRICSVITVTGATHSEVVKAVNNTAFTDFEDCLQDRCAVTVKADYIITRNIKDFVNSETKAITPEDFYNNIVPQILSK